jgi:Peptidase family M1 domain
MFTNHLIESNGLEPVSAARKKNTRGNAYLPIASIAIALLCYGGVTSFLLSQSMARVYGFPVFHDVRTRLEIALRVCPMLAAILMVLISRARESVSELLVTRVLATRRDRHERTWRTVIILAVNVMLAIAILAVTACALAIKFGPAPGAPAPVTLLWVAGEFMCDVLLIGIFTTGLYAFTRRLWLTILLFTVYIIGVVFAGRHWAITSYIGFASGVPVMLTTYSVEPLYDAAGWLFRGYWASVTLFILSVLHAFSNRSEPLLISVGRAFRSGGRLRLPHYVSIATLVLSALICLSLFQLQRQGIAKYQASSRTNVVSGWRAQGDSERLHLNHYDVHLTFTPRSASVAVRGLLTFDNTMHSVRTAYFQAPSLVDLDDFRIDGAGKYQLHTSGKYIQVQFENALPAGSQAHLSYSGRIQSAGPFDLPVQAKVLRNSFFLTDSDFLFAARSASCLGPAPTQPAQASAEQACGDRENYMMSDMATGKIAVASPRELGVAGPGEESVHDMNAAASEHAFDIAKPRLATFMVACAPFVQKVAASEDGETTIRVYGSASAAAMGGFQAEVAARILAFYRTFWSAYSRPDLQVIETPTPLGEAVSFPGALAISDKIITSRDPVSGLASNLLEFVMAHEIAHQWWGYRLVPERSPGRLFLLESFPQFAAYQYLSSRSILSSQAAAQNEKRRYELARARLGRSEVPLVRLETANELAYNKGPFVLLSLDEFDGHLLMNRLGGLIETYSHDTYGNVEPEQFVTSLIEQLPEEHRQAARSLLYNPDGKSDAGGALAVRR